MKGQEKRNRAIRYTIAGLMLCVCISFGGFMFGTMIAYDTKIEETLIPQALYIKFASSLINPKPEWPNVTMWYEGSMGVQETPIASKPINTQRGIEASIREEEKEPEKIRKPIIYLYPEQKTDVTVKLDYNGKLTYTYPQYADGWRVTASPDGTLINHADGREYSYLFWEGDSNTDFDFRKGFVVKGSDTVAFLQEKLAYLGLTPREYNEFIVYWLPQMQDNPYNLIAFQGAAYTDNAKLTITPKPDSVLRVFMAFKPLGYSMDIQPQELKTFERKGFVVVEWGGTRVP